MARVYRARHTVLDKWIALKVLAPELVTNGAARQRFFTEARAAAAIEHPHVVTMFDAGVDGGNPYLVMELLDGETLAQHLDRCGRLTVEQVVSLAVPLLAALAAAHDAGVVHRDLKPANIFLARSPAGGVVPKLLDFGISRFKASEAELNVVDTARNELLGSPLYMPPEALRDSQSLTQRSDQYSFGVVLYECIAGRPPFAELTLLPLFEAILGGVQVSPQALVPDIPELLERLILRAMNVEPAQRFEHVRDLGRALLDLGGEKLREAYAPAFVRPPEASVDAAAPSLAEVSSLSPSMQGLSVAAGGSRERLRPLWSALLAATLLIILALSARLQGKAPSAAPMVAPIAAPTAAPTAAPMVAPIAAPTAAPTAAPMVAPTAAPTAPPMAAPIALPPVGPSASAAVPASRTRPPRRRVARDRELEESFFPKRAAVSAAPIEPTKMTLSNESPLLD